ncbi:MAG: hypothetical protein HZA90_09410 [Verrucomicrobia bacterium]|nr:hypothetical protein [Verrucomicrobiota bacterium]
MDNLRRDFNRKLAQWRANGRTATSLVDKRPEANAERRVELAPEDRRVLLATGLFKYGGERAGAPAWRECRENGMLSNRLCAGHVMNPARKSYVPKSVMREIGPDLKALTPWRRGPRQAKLNGAYIDTFHDEAAGDVFTSDDFTLEVYFYVPNNKGWFDLTRGQWLPLVDCRSKKILDFILIPERDYTGRHIYTLFNRAFTEIGHPREEIVLERGKWKSSKLVGGPLPWGDVNLNLFERLGIKLTFANPGNARAKIAENIGNLFQASMRDQPGWVGPNEQVIKIESVQAAKREVEARRKHPADAGFLSFEEFFRALNSKVDRYNATEQESEVMGGRKEVTMAPDEAWRLHQPRDAAGGVIGLTKLPPECRHLLMPAMKVRVGRNGISFTLSGERFTFRTGLAPLHEHEVIAYFDPHLPDFLVVVTDKKQVIIVPREPRISRFHATPEQLAAASASVADWNRNHSGRLAELKHDFMPPARANVVSPATAAEGQEIAAQRKAISAKTEARKQTAVKAQRLARDLGLTPPATDRMANALNDIFSVEPEPEERAEETAQSPPSKEYQLKSNGNWELLHQAIREKVTLVFLYAKPGEKGEWRATRPFAAQQGADGQILVKAYDLKRQENRTFLFARMLKFRLCKKNGSPLHPENVHEHE